MPRDSFDYMLKQWKEDGNPFPVEGIRIQNKEEPFSASVFPDETQEFRRKFIRSGVRGSPAVGFLWSQGIRADTGFGKTTLMQEITREINSDFGDTTLRKAGATQAVLPLVGCAFSSLNNLNATGLYPVLFNAVIDMSTVPRAGMPSLFDAARSKIIEYHACDPDAIAQIVLAAWQSIVGTGARLRPELVQAFACGGSTALRDELTQVSLAARLRNGLQYLDFALAVLAAANTDHLFLMIDQLEDLATTRSVTAAKRSREIGRIRDLLESAPYATRLHMIFTFHNRAAQVLDRPWEENRLPRFEISKSNTSAIVVLRGMKDDGQAKELLKAYLNAGRTEVVEDDLLPFENEAVSVLRKIAEDRPGILLSRARELYQAAAEVGVPSISGRWAMTYFDEVEAPLASADEGEEAAIVPIASDIDDLLFGRSKK
jgi:hypothetical protein